MKFKKFYPPTNSQWDLILTAAHSSDRETCGVLVGHIINDTAYIDEVRQIKNIADIDDSFIMDPQEYLTAIMDTDFYSDDPKYSLLGIYHTHVNFPGYPSSTDWKTADAGQVVQGMYMIFTTEGDSAHFYYWDGKQFVVLRRTNEKN